MKLKTFEHYTIIYLKTSDAPNFFAPVKFFSKETPLNTSVELILQIASIILGLNEVHSHCWHVYLLQLSQVACTK